MSLEKPTASEVAAQLAAHERFCEEVTKQREANHEYVRGKLEKLDAKSVQNDAAINDIRVNLAEMIATTKTTSAFIKIIGSGLLTVVAGILIVLLTRGIE